MRFLALLLLCSCGTLQEPFVEDDGRFYRYRAFFEKHTGHKTGYIPIIYGAHRDFAEKDKRVIAFCTKTGFVGSEVWHAKKIVIGKRFNNLAHNYRYAVIAHELIHCHLEIREHQPDDSDEFVLMAEALDTSAPLTYETLIEQLENYR